MVSIGEFLVGFVRYGDLLVEILVEGVEIGGSKLGFMTGNVICGNIETGVVSFIGEEGRNAGGHMGSVVVNKFGDWE